MIRSEMALWPHPAHSVVFVPRYSFVSSPMRLTFLRGFNGVTVATVSPFCKNDLLAADAGAVRQPGKLCAGLLHRSLPG